jgi:hypothetical protein
MRFDVMAAPYLLIDADDYGRLPACRSGKRNRTSRFAGLAVKTGATATLLARGVTTLTGSANALNECGINTPWAYHRARPKLHWRRTHDIAIANEHQHRRHEKSDLGGTPERNADAHIKAHDNYRVILKYEVGEVEIGSIGIQHGSGATEYCA